MNNDKIKKEYFDKIFENHNAIMLLIDPETGQILNSNKSAAKFYGYDIKTLCSMNINQINTLPEDELKFKLSETKYTDLHNFEFQHKLSNGDIRFVEVNSSPIEYDGYTVIFDIVHDINPLKEIEKKLNEQNLLLTTILENSPIGYAVNQIDDGKALFVSSKFEEIYGVDRYSIKSVDDFYNKVYIDPEYRDEMRKKTTDDMFSGDPTRYKWENIRIDTKDGKKKYITAYNIPVIKQNLMVSTVIDVTDKKMEDDLINEKLEEIKKMNELMIGRELEMIKLKKENSKHEE